MRRSSRAVWGLILVFLGTSADAQTFQKHVVVAQERYAAEAGRDVFEAGRQRGRRGGRDGLRAGGHAPGGGEPRRRRVPRRLSDAAAATFVTFDFRETAPKAATPRCTSGPTASPCPTTAPGRGRPVCRGPSAGWPGPCEARPARLGRARPARPPGWPATGSPLGDACPLAQRPVVRPTPTRRRPRRPRPAARPARRLPRVGRRLPQARRLPLAARRPARPARPGRRPSTGSPRRGPTSSTPGGPPA